MVAKCEINDKAIKIISQPYSVRAVVKSDKVMFSVNDILYACGVKAPRKWVERNADKFPWMWADSYPYPTKTVKGWRTNKVVFVSAPVGKRLVRLTACSASIREWLLGEVLTYYPNKVYDDSDEHVYDYEDVSIRSKDVSRPYQFDFSSTGFTCEGDEPGDSEELEDSEEEKPTVRRMDVCQTENDSSVEQMIDSIIVDTLELDRKDYGSQIDCILLKLLDLKRKIIHTQSK